MLVVDKDMPIVSPVGAGPFSFGVENPKFERYFARIDSQEHLCKVTGGFVCHNAICFSVQRKVLILPMWGSLTSEITSFPDLYFQCRFFAVDYASFASNGKHNVRHSADEGCPLRSGTVPQLYEQDGSG